MVWMVARGLELTRKLMSEMSIRLECGGGVEHRKLPIPEGAATTAADSCYAAGLSLLFNGRLNEAAETFLASWDLAKQAGEREVCWKSCLGVARCHFADQRPALGRHFLQLARNAFFSRSESQSSANVPGEILLSVLTDQTTDETSDTDGMTLRVAQLLSVRNASESLDLRARAAEDLARCDIPARKKLWLSESLNEYLQAGNLYAAMLVAEPLAICWLEESDRSTGTEVIEHAAHLAEVLELENRRVHYRKFSARIRSALSALERRTFHSVAIRLMESRSGIQN